MATEPQIHDRPIPPAVAEVAALLREARMLAEWPFWERGADYEARRDAYLAAKAALLGRLP